MKGIVEVKETIYTTAKQLSRHVSTGWEPKIYSQLLGWTQTGESEKRGGILTACFWHQILGARLNGLLGTHSEKRGDLTACY